MNRLKVLELFGGIGACSKALEKLEIDYEIVDYVEIDKYAVKSFNAMHNTNFEPQDICKWDKDIEVDLIMHGSPCQDFSLAGKQAGGDEGSGTRSSLMYETLRIVEKLKPKYVIWENVKNIISKKHVHNFNNYINRMSELGYKSFYKVLNAKDYGIPQNRERVFTVSILDGSDYEFPKPIPLKLKLKDMLEDNVDEKYYLSDKQLESLENGSYNASKPSVKLQITDKGLCQTLDTMSGGNRQPLIRVKNATKKGYLEATDGDGIDISSRMEYHRGNVQKGKIQTLTTSGGNDRGVVNKPKVLGGIGEKDSNNNTQWKQQNRVYDNNVGISVTTCFNPNYIDNHLRIRKLTPCECWKLMGFDKSDFDKASKVCSNAQLYKQAGNSIVVNVLMAIFKELFKKR